jgi:auxin efflux carrier family protein
MPQVRWSYGVRLLAQADDEPTKQPTSGPSETSPLLSDSEPPFQPYGSNRRVLRHEPSGSTTARIHGYQYPESPVKDDGESSSSDVPNIEADDPNHLRVRPTPQRKRTNIFHSFPNTPNQSHSLLPSFASTSTASPEPQSDSENDTDEELPRNRQRSDHQPITTTRSSPLRTFLRRSKRHLIHGWRNLNEFMTVPLWAALASIIVACVQPIQHALEEHMQPVKGSLAAAGQCSIPLTLVVLGAYFYPPPKEEPVSEQRRSSLSTLRSTSSLLNSAKDIFKFTNGRQDSQPHPNGGLAPSSAEGEKRPGETKTVVIAILSRMIITPILILPLMAISTRFDLHAIFDEYVYLQNVCFSFHALTVWS